MKQPNIAPRVTRRSFARLATATLGAAIAAPALGQEKSKPITSDSVVGDPDAPGPSPGTVSEPAPFDAALAFKPERVKPKLEPFPLGDVRLLASDFLDAREADRKYLHELSADRMLHTFRLTAGLPSTAQPLGGWEKPDCELRGHFAGGHFLSGLALMYASTGDQDLKQKADYMVAELAKCQRADGYLSAYPDELFTRLRERQKIWAPFYTLHKIMAGLLDVHQYCANQQALVVLKGVAGWVDGWTAALGDDRMQMVLDTEYGGMNEVLYNLAAVTGDNQYVTVADRFTKRRFFNPLALQRDELIGLHTNTHIPQVIGAARRYELSADPRFHDVAEVFWRQVVDTRTYASGGTSNNEGWLVEPNQLATEIKLGSATNECCCAYNMMKLTRQLYTWSGDPRYFDYYERLLYNHRLGTIDVVSGVTQYYLGMVPGSWRTFGTVDDSFWCCNGTGVEEYAKLNDSIYYEDQDGLYVNLFIPSELDWKSHATHVRQETAFPRSPRITLRVSPARPTRFTLHLRVPAWVASAPEVRINGVVSEVSASPGSSLSIRRLWRAGDRVQIELPMKLYVEKLPDDPTMQAIFYGPLLLAGELGNAGLTSDMVVNHEGPDLKKHAPPAVPSLRAISGDPSGWIEPVPATPGVAPLSFRTMQQEQNVTLVPFHTVAGQRYSVYWKVV